MTKPDPELLPSPRPRCAKCNMRMITTDVSLSADGYEECTLECMRCGNIETKKMAADPVKTHNDDRLKGELGKSTKYYSPWRSSDRNDAR